MFSKNEIKRGDKICFNGGGFFKVFEITDKYITVGVNKYFRETKKLSAFRIMKINGRYYVNERLDSV